MKDLLAALLKLQAIEFGELKETNEEVVVAQLRAQVPPQILAHYDRLIVRGKKGVALVRNQACTGCHMRLPIGTINTLMQGNDIQLCDTCGRYLCLAPAEEAPAPSADEAKAAKKAAPKRRKPKTAAPSAS